MDPLTIGIVTAAVGAFSGWMGHLFDSQSKRKEAEAQKALIEQQYKLKKQEAELEYAEAQRQANKNADEADKQADLTDLGQDIAERTLSNDINSAIDNLYLSQTNDAWEWNSAAMSAGANTGNALAQVAASGVRAGSSLNDAILMESATNEAQLQFAQDAKRRSDNNNLASVLNGLAGQKFNIMGNRIGADVTRQNAQDLRNSYLEGGYNYNIYQNQMEQMRLTNNYNLDQLNKEIKKNSPNSIDFWLNAGTSILTGASNGFQTGYNVGTTYDKIKANKPGYNTKVKTQSNNISFGNENYLIH